MSGLRELAHAFLEGGEVNAGELEVLKLVALEARRAGVLPTLADLRDPTDRAAWVWAARRRDLEVGELSGLLEAGGELGALAYRSGLGDRGADEDLAGSLALAAAASAAIGGAK